MCVRLRLRQSNYRLYLVQRRAVERPACRAGSVQRVTRDGRCTLTVSGNH
jgi:hypothetical protein